MDQKTVLVLFFISIPFFCLGQQQAKLDSLNKVVKNSEDIVDKVETLKEIYNIQLYKNPEKAKETTQYILKISTEENYPNGIAMGNYGLANYYSINYIPDSANFYYDKTIKISQEHGIDIHLAHSLSGKALLMVDKGDYFGAIKLQDSLVPMFGKLKDYLSYGVAIANSASCYLTMGQYDKAMERYIDALKVLDTIEREPFRKADILRSIGSIEFAQGNYEESIPYYNRAMTIYKNTLDYLFQSYILNDLGITYVEMGELEVAQENYEKSLQLSRKYKFINNTANVLANLGTLHRKRGNYNKALENLLEALEINESRNSIDNQISVLGEIGKTYTELNDIPNALDFLNESIRLADSVNTENQLLKGLGYRAEAYEQSKEYRNANTDRKRYQELNDSIFNAEKTKQIEQIKTLYETERKETEIALQKEEIKTLNEKAKVDKLTKGLYAGGMASALALSGLLVFGFRQRIKKNRIEKEKISKELEHKQKELTSQTLHLVQKSQFIAEIKENLENLKNSPEKFRIEFKRIVMLLKKQSAADKDWEVFKSYFSEVHQDFEEKLRSYSNRITDKELRLSSYVKMGLNNNEIADILNVLPSSIHTSKYRLKQKLNLDKDLDFDSFIKNL